MACEDAYFQRLAATLNCDAGDPKLLDHGLSSILKRLGQVDAPMQYCACDVASLTNLSIPCRTRDASRCFCPGRETDEKTQQGIQYLVLTDSAYDLLNADPLGRVRHGRHFRADGMQVVVTLKLTEPQRPLAGETDVAVQSA